MKRYLAPLSVILLLAPFAAFAKPTISTITPETAAANEPVTLRATVNSSINIDFCKLYIDLAEVGSMNMAGSQASLSYTFTFGGSHIGFVYCRDTQGGIAAGDNTSIWVTGQLQNQQPFTGSPSPTPTPTPTPTPAPQSPGTIPPHTLIKLACAANVSVDDPCKAVYYVGIDGKRHAFPHSKVFFTWYLNFDGVQTVSSADMGAIPLGKNITYRPGSRLVKFTTLNKVYAVGSGGVLRWVQTEQTATALYGTDWTKKIDDIADTFYSNYTFGVDIANSSDYNPTLTMTQNVAID